MASMFMSIIFVMCEIKEHIRGWFLFFFQPKATGEQKTKPTQNTVRELRGLGLSPDLVSLNRSIRRIIARIYLSDLQNQNLI